MELSERLKENYEKIGTQGWQSIFDDVMDNLPAILAALDSSEHNAKCVQFAEDVEKMAARGCNPSLEDVYDNSDDPGDPEKYSVRWWDGKLWQFSYGVDYHTAARKAVEALRAAKEGA